MASRLCFNRAGSPIKAGSLIQAGVLSWMFSRSQPGASIRSFTVSIFYISWLIKIVVVFCCRQLKVMNNKLFNIEPKKGRLSPGESCTVTLTYKHSITGTDRLPVVFKLSRGREILVRLLFTPCIINLYSLQIERCSSGEHLKIWGT